MYMKVTINIRKKHFYLISLLIILLLVTTLVAARYATTVPNPGHGADAILVSVNGQEKSLQEAIDGSLSNSNNCVKKQMKIFCYTEASNYRDCIIVPEGTANAAPLPNGYLGNYDWVDMGPTGYTTLICS